MELLNVIYVFVGIVALIGILNIKDVKFFNKITIKNFVTLSVMTAITLPLGLLSMFVIKDMALGFLLLSMFVCEILSLNTIYVKTQYKKALEKQELQKKEAEAAHKKEKDFTGLKMVELSEQNDEALFFQKTKNTKKRAI